MEFLLNRADNKFIAKLLKTIFYLIWQWAKKIGTKILNFTNTEKYKTTTLFCIKNATNH